MKIISLLVIVATVLITAIPVEAYFLRKTRNSIIIRTDGSIIRPWQYGQVGKAGRRDSKPMASLEQYGIASYYGDYFQNRLTASGMIFKKEALTAAHRTLPLGTVVEVYSGKKSVIVTINDRGPFVDGRIIDLSEAAFAELAPLSKGLTLVRLVVRELPQKKRKPFFCLESSGQEFKSISSFAGAVFLARC